MTNKPFDMDHYWTKEGQEHFDVVQASFEELHEPFSHWVDDAVDTIQRGGKILFFGNGGSASDAQHIATELTARFIKDREAIAALALTTDTSALTAIGNDYGFDYLFARQIEALGKPEDMAVGITTSGKSANVLKALQTGREMGMNTVALSGKTGGDLFAYCDTLIIVPSETTARIQEVHILLGHMFCGALEQKLGLVDDE